SVIGNTELFHSKGDRPFNHFFRTRLAVRGKAGVHMTVCNHILPPYPFIQVFALIAQTMQNSACGQSLSFFSASGQDRAASRHIAVLIKDDSLSRSHCPYFFRERTDDL